MEPETVLKIGKALAFTNKQLERVTVTLDSIDIPKTNVPGNRNFYTLTVRHGNESQQFRFDPYNCYKILRYYGLDFAFTGHSNEGLELLTFNLKPDFAAFLFNPTPDFPPSDEVLNNLNEKLGRPQASDTTIIILKNDRGQIGGYFDGKREWYDSKGNKVTRYHYADIDAEPNSRFNALVTSEEARNKKITDTLEEAYPIQEYFR